MQVTVNSTSQCRMIFGILSTYNLNQPRLNLRLIECVMDPSNCSCRAKDAPLRILYNVEEFISMLAREMVFYDTVQEWKRRLKTFRNNRYIQYIFIVHSYFDLSFFLSVSKKYKSIIVFWRSVLFALDFLVLSTKR